MAQWIKTTGEKFFKERQEKLDAMNFETVVVYLIDNRVYEDMRGVPLHEIMHVEDTVDPSEVRVKHIVRWKLQIRTPSSEKYDRPPKTRELEDFYEYYEDDKPRAWYFTFGSGHYDREGNSLKDKYTMISARSKEEARFKMWKWWGEKRANQYDTPEQAGVKEFNLKLVI